MKINRKSQNDINFENLKVGETFVINENLYIKMTSITDSYDNEHNCVNLETGEYDYFAVGTPVKDVNKFEIVEKRKK